MVAVRARVRTAACRRGPSVWASARAVSATCASSVSRVAGGDQCSAAWTASRRNGSTTASAVSRRSTAVAHCTKSAAGTAPTTSTSQTVCTATAREIARGSSAGGGDQRGEGRVVGPDAGEGEVLVVEQQQLRRPARSGTAPRCGPPGAPRRARGARARRRRGRTRRRPARCGARLAAGRSLRRAARSRRRSRSSVSSSVPAVSSQPVTQRDRSRPLASASSPIRSSRLALPQACFGEVRPQPGHERVLADVGDQLLEHARALRVGDRRRSPAAAWATSRDRLPDRVRRRRPVGAVAGELAAGEEAGPRVGELGGRGRRPVSTPTRRTPR